MRQPHEIRLIAVDLDGTLLNSQHQLTERTKDALCCAQAHGVQVVLATGKTRQSAVDALRQLELKTPGVYLQGLVIYNADGSVRHERTLSPELVRDLVAFARRHDASLVAYSGGRIMTERPDDKTDRLLLYHEPEPEQVDSLVATQATLPFHKLLFVDDPARIDALRRLLSEGFQGRVTLVQALADMLELLPPGASKGAGLKWLLDDLGVDLKHVLAIGDGENDAEMLRLAAIGVAVGNAMPEAKAAADYTVASNDADGVAEAVERFVLAPQVVTC